jgi:probable rRNA maturation factor
MTALQPLENKIASRKGGLKSGPPIHFVPRLRHRAGDPLIIFQKPVAGLGKSTLERFVLRARRAVRLPGTVNLLITNGSQLRALNRRFRGVDKTTDVLSFPAAAIENGPKKRIAGDVAISFDIARDNARRLGHSVADEVKILALHGILHLAGFDHENDRGEMAREEIRLRRQLNLEVSLIERTQPDSTKRSADRELRQPPRARRRTA